MAKRKVFGRRRVVHEEATYVIELREDGLYVRRKHYPREECRISFTTLLQYSKPQLELNLRFNEPPVEPSIKESPLPDLPKGQLVSNKPTTTGSTVHARDVESSETLEGRLDGMAPYLGPPPLSAYEALCLEAAKRTTTGNQLQ